MDNDYRVLYNIHERVAILETKMDEMLLIKGKLDELLELKQKGVGAFWLVSLLVTSGLLGLAVTLINWFSARPHL